MTGDEGVGVRLLNSLLRCGDDWDGAVEFLAGGTCSLSLLEPIAGCGALVLLDAVALGSVPGTVYVRRDEDALDLRYHPAAARGIGAGKLLTMAWLLGDLPKRIFLVGIEPARASSGIELSEPVRKALPVAVKAARYAVSKALAALPSVLSCPSAASGLKRPRFRGWSTPSLESAS